MPPASASSHPPATPHCEPGHDTLDRRGRHHRGLLGNESRRTALIGHQHLPRWARDCIALLAPALLAALIIIELGGEHWAALNGTQVAGVAVAGAARAVKAPMLAAIASGVLVTALLRLATG